MNIKNISVSFLAAGCLLLATAGASATAAYDTEPLQQRKAETKQVVSSKPQTGKVQINQQAVTPKPQTGRTDTQAENSLQTTPQTKTISKQNSVVLKSESPDKLKDKDKNSSKNKQTSKSKGKQDKQGKNKPVPAAPAKPSFSGVELPENYKQISIFGDAVAMKEQAVRYIKTNNPSVKLSCSVESLVDLYWQEAKREGVRPDIALCQALVETGFFKYGGDVVHHQNNFCGLGTTGKGVKGASFKTPLIGVRAHIQHLLAYSEAKKPVTPIVDPRYSVAHAVRAQAGFVDTWYGLNGTWAMGSSYCEKIMAKYQSMLKMPGGRVVLPPVDPKNKYKSSIKLRVQHILNDNKE